MPLDNLLILPTIIIDGKEQITTSFKNVLRYSLPFITVLLVVGGVLAQSMYYLDALFMKSKTLIHCVRDSYLL